MYVLIDANCFYQYTNFLRILEFIYFKIAVSLKIKNNFQDF